MPITGEQIPTLAVLAGGEGSRMGGPKAWLRVCDQPILEFLLTHWNWPGPTLLVTAPSRERPPGWEKFDDVAIDAVAGGGPLVGVTTALREAKTSTIVVATCDMPAIGLDQLQWIARQLADNLGVMCRRASGGIEPFPSAFDRSAAEVIEQRLAESKRSLHLLLEVPRFVTAAAPASWSDEVWTNLNSPADLGRLQARHDHS